MQPPCSDINQWWCTKAVATVAVGINAIDTVTVTTGSPINSNKDIGPPVTASIGGQSVGPAVMATQTFMPEMQALPPGTVPPQQGNGNSNITNSNTVTVAVVTLPAPTQQPPLGSQQPQTPTRTQAATSQPQPTSVVTVVQAPDSQQQQAQVTVVGVNQQANNPPPPSQTQQQQPASQQPPPPPPPPQATQQQQAPTIVQTTAQPQQFITVPVSDNESPGQDTVSLQNTTQAVHSTYVQYVESSTDPSIYAASNGQMSAYPVYCVSDTSTMYTSATAYYNTGNNTAVTYSQVSPSIGHGTVAGSVSMQGQILTHQGTSTTYLVQGGTMDGDNHPLQHASRASPQAVSLQQEGGVAYLVQGSTMDGENPHLTPATRVSPATFPEVIEGQPFGFEVQWLIDNYETAEGVSLPRSTLYSHYLRHCSEHKLDPVNAASFGKLIRSVFLGLRTRRLGTRGNSKYHYYGIRVKPTSPLTQISEDVGTMALRQQPINQGKRFKPSSTHKVESHSDASHNQGNQSHTSSSSSDSTSPQQPRHQQFLGDASGAIPHFASLNLGEFALPDGVLLDDLDMFKTLYKEHCEAFLDAVINLQFSMVETLWQQFWRTSQTARDLEDQLSTAKLFLLCSCEGVQKFVQKADYEFYQNLVEVLIPDVLRPIPSSLTQAIRNFAKNLEGWLTSSMVGTPSEMVKVKVSAVSAFAQTLRRYTSLNHLAQAARAVLQNASQISQMLTDLNRVDFHNVQEQASWVCQCDDEMVQKLEQDFKLTLQQQNSLEQWAAWLEGVVSQVLLPHEGKPDFAKAARQFLLKWSFYSSMVIRDLTLRSAASFGSFHLIRLLYDEYMFYLIEHRVAQATGETPIAVMGEFIGYGHKVSLHDISDNKPLVAGVFSGDSNLLGNDGTVVITNGNHVNHMTSTSVLVNHHHHHTGSQQQPVQQMQQQSTQPMQQQQNMHMGPNPQSGVSKIVTVGALSPSASESLHMSKRLKAS